MYITVVIASEAKQSRRNLLSLLPQFRHDPEWLLAAGDALAIVEGVAPALRVGIPGRAGRVRAEGDVLQREQLVIRGRRLLDHHVETGTRDLLVAHRLVQSLLIDDRTAACVDQDRGLFHQAEFVL